MQRRRLLTLEAGPKSSVEVLPRDAHFNTAAILKTMLRRIAAVLFFLAVSVAAVAPIRSYDYFWHLAAGRWIADHHALPRVDPLAVASAKDPWINGEWLYEVVLQAIQRSVGDPGISLVNALLVASIFTAGFWFRNRMAGGEDSSHEWTYAEVCGSLLIAAVAFAGAFDRLGVRPSTAAAMLMVMALGCLRSRLTLRWLLVTYVFVSVLWINVHPSAILAPMLAIATITIDRKRIWIALASAAALLINPFGWRGVAAPVQLTALIRSQEFVNAEWLPSPPAIFPLFYLTIAIAVLWFLVSDRHRESLWRIAIFVVLAALAVRSVRNQGLYFAALPLLLPRWNLRDERLSAVFATCAIIPLIWVFRQDTHQRGIDATRFPVAAVRSLAALQLAGNIYNADQFGGLLEWTFYPERRALTDGRNELFRDFIAEDARARGDSRAWHALLDRYSVALAVDEYQRERIEVMDVASGQRRSLPASLVRYRRRDWALLAFDDAAMIFARRSAFPPALLAGREYRYLVPDDPAIGYASPQILEAARAEMVRARKEIGPSAVLAAMEQGAR